MAIVMFQVKCRAVRRKILLLSLLTFDNVDVESSLSGILRLKGLNDDVLR